MENVVITAVLSSKPGMEESLYKILQKVVEPSRNEEGCMTYQLHQSLDDVGTFIFYEVWENEEAVQSHIMSEHYKAYREQAESLIETRHVYRLKKV
jgi:quinol monooxygenase YgiN